MFLPKKSKVFERLVEQSLILKEAVQIFQNIVNDWKQLNDGCSRLGTLESKADKFVHNITEDIEKTFILPLDKEDIKELTESLDDIIDNLEQVANRLHIYKIPKSNQPLKDFSLLISEAVQKIHQGILMIKEGQITSKNFALGIEKLHEIENQGDGLHRKVLENMMGDGLLDFDGKNPLSIIKWKEVFQTLEDTLDKCEDFAAIFERLRIKYR